MTEYTYDPELPYAVIGANTGKVYARFAYKEKAMNYVGWHLDVDFLDTTPKPKIPQDARWVTWLDSRGMRCYAGWADDNVWIADSGDTLSISDLLDDIGDAEVTVLVPKETS